MRDATIAYVHGAIVARLDDAHNPWFLQHKKSTTQHLIAGAKRSEAQQNNPTGGQR
jgi:hypothetical protein